MTKNRIVTSESLFRNVLLAAPNMQSIVDLLGIKGPFGNQTFAQVCKSANMHESTLSLLFEACLNDDFQSGQTLPSYGLLQLTAILPGICDRIDEQFQEVLLKESAVESYLIRIRDSIREHKEELINVLQPHVESIYALYYSPEYTSVRQIFWTFSVEFFPANELPQAALNEVFLMLEPVVSWRSLELLFRLQLLIQALERIESRLLKPLVLNMENEIVGSFQRKKLKSYRRTYLTFPESIHSKERLSKREQEVLTGVALGFQNKEIAERLGIALTTVISHRKNIVSKLGISTLAGLTVYAYKNGFLRDFVGKDSD